MSEKSPESETTQRPKRHRRRGGVKPESLASRRRSRQCRRGVGDEPIVPESPADVSAFDSDYWNSQRPPHWG